MPTFSLKRNIRSSMHIVWIIEMMLLSIIGIKFGSIHKLFPMLFPHWMRMFLWADVKRVRGCVFTFVKDLWPFIYSFYYPYWCWCLYLASNFFSHLSFAWGPVNNQTLGLVRKNSWLSCRTWITTISCILLKKENNTRTHEKLAHPADEFEMHINLHRHQRTSGAMNKENNLFNNLPH